MSAYGADKSRSRAGIEPVAPLEEALPKLPRYNVIQKLAVGGMATVFLAQKEGASEICVIKQLHAHLAEEGVVASRFMREAQVSFHLNHANIARILDSKREAGLLYLAIEYIPGQDVESMMFKLMEQRKMLPPELSVTVTLDVLAGLDYAHSLTGPDDKPLEIVHRDLSPRNVMVSYDGQVKIIDFGLARTNLGDFRTAPGMVLGTLRYMSPEQAVAEPVDRRSDIYSWSVVLYEMLSGRPLVMGANAQEVLRAVVTQVPLPLSKLNPNLPKALDRVLERGLAKDRRDRFKTGADMRDALIEAAGPLASLDAERHALIGRFVRDLFPEAAAESDALQHAARSEGGFEPTRVQPSAHDPNQEDYVTRLQTVAAMVGSRGSMPPEVMELTRPAMRRPGAQSRVVPRPAGTQIMSPRQLMVFSGLAFVLIALLLLLIVMPPRTSKTSPVEIVPESPKDAPRASRTSDNYQAPEASPAAQARNGATNPIVAPTRPKATPGDAKATLGEAKATPGEAKTPLGEAKKAEHVSAKPQPTEAKPEPDSKHQSELANIERLLEVAEKKIDIDPKGGSPGELNDALKAASKLAEQSTDPTTDKGCVDQAEFAGAPERMAKKLRSCLPKLRTNLR